MMKKMLRNFGPATVALFLVGCQNLETGQPSAAVPSPSLPPNYETPDSEFVPAKFSALSSEFLDEYAGKYVVVDGRFLHSSQGALIWQKSGRPVGVSDMMSAIIGPADTLGGRLLTVSSGET